QVVRVLPQTTDSRRQLEILRGVNEALKGRGRMEMPKEWPHAYAELSRSKHAEVRAQTMALAVTFGDRKAFADLRRVLTSPEAAPAARHDALAALVGAKDTELPRVLHGLVKDKDAALRSAAIRGLADFDDPKTPPVLLAAYPSLNAEE